MVDSGSTYRPSGDQDMYGSGVASLIGGSGISLDGQSVQLPEDSCYDLQDDISSIQSSYYKGAMDPPPKINSVQTVESMEEGNLQRLSPASIALSTRSCEKEGKGKEASLVTSTQKRPPNMRNTSKLSVNGSQDEKGCLPKWVSLAPLWLKFVIVFSTSLLVGAVVLVTVALSTALADQSDSSSSESNSFFTYSPGVVPPPLSPSSPGLIYTTPSPTPLKTYVFDAESNLAPSTSPALESQNVQSPTPTSAPQLNPLPNVALGATPAPTVEEQEASPVAGGIEQSTSPGNNSNASSVQQDPASAPYDPFETSFFVVGGRFTNDALAQVPQKLQTMPIRGGTSFMVHLGDWNSPYATRCDQQSFEDVDDLFSNSSIPVYFIPGDNDFNDCPDPGQARSYWHEYLLGYETKHWPDPSHWTVARAAPNNYPENFAFSYNDILFVGINLVGGVVQNTTEWSTRQAANLDWIDANYEQNKNAMKAFVLFAHADPDVPSNSAFYEPFKERVKKDYNKVPVVLIHRNLGVEPWGWETEFENIENLSVIVVAGSIWPPLMGVVDFRREDPFYFDQSNWYQEYLDYQTNNSV